MLFGWGLGGFGLTPWGGGPIASFDLLGVQPVSETVARYTFTEPPYWDGVGGVADALAGDRYAIVALNGVGIDGQAVRPVLVLYAQSVDGYPECIDVVVDRPFSPYPCLYTASANGLRGSISGLPLTVGSTSAQMYGLLRTVESAARELTMRNRDMASPQTPAATMDPLPDPLGAVLGSYNVDSTGDYAFDEGLTSYRKRGLRRTYCRKRRFVFLPPDWGAGVVDKLKRSNSPATREAVRADIEEQWRQEPETRSCTVTTLVSPQAPSVVRFRINAVTRDGRAVDVTLPFKTG